MTEWTNERLAALEAALEDWHTAVYVTHGAEALALLAAYRVQHAALAALELAARATCDAIQRYGWCQACSKATRPRPGYQGDPHRADCPVGTLERLLEET